MQYLMRLFIVLICVSLAHQAYAQDLPDTADEEQESYFLNEVDTLNQIREIQKDLRRLEKELERAQERLDQYTRDHNYPKELLDEDVKQAQ